MFYIDSYIEKVFNIGLPVYRHVHKQYSQNTVDLLDQIHTVQTSSFFTPAMAGKVKAFLKQNMSASISSETIVDQIHLKVTTISKSVDASTHDKWVAYVVWCIKCIKLLGVANQQLRNINIDLLFMPLKKKFSSPISSDHVNSGWCWKDDTKSDIFIYRSEEMSKVIIHELSHALLQEFVPKESNELVIEHSPWSRKPLTINVSECIVETLTSILHTLFYVLSEKSKISIDDKSMKRIYNCLLTESKFIDRQSKRVLRIFDQGQFNMVKKSNALSYYVGKASILSNTNDVNFLLYLLNYRNEEQTIQFITNSVYKYANSIPVFDKKKDIKQHGHARMTRWDMSKWIQTYIQVHE